MIFLFHLKDKDLKRSLMTQNRLCALPGERRGAVLASEGSDNQTSVSFV